MHFVMWLAANFAAVIQVLQPVWQLLGKYAGELDSQRLAFVALDQAVAEPQKPASALQWVSGPSCCRLSHTALILSIRARCQCFAARHAGMTHVLCLSPSSTPMIHLHVPDNKQGFGGESAPLLSQRVVWLVAVCASCPASSLSGLQDTCMCP